MHKGAETIIDKSGTPHDYVHDSISIVYSYILNDDGSIQEVDDGNIAEADVDNQATTYAAPGPFTQWSVSIADSDLDLLDLSGVDGSYFDFFGTNYSLA